MNASRVKAKKRLDMKRFFITMLIVVLFGGASLLTGAYEGIKAMSFGDFMARDVVIDGVQVGGLSFEEAEQLVLANEEQFLKDKQVSVVYKDEEYNFLLKSLGFGTNAQDVLSAAFAYNKRGESVIEDYRHNFEPVSYYTELTIDETVLKTTLREYFGEYDVAPVDATASFVPASGSFEYKEGSEGAMVDIQKLAEDIIERAKSGDASPVEAELTTVAPLKDLESIKGNTELLSEQKTGAVDDAARNSNISKLCAALNGVEVRAGETLSLLSICGDLSPESGYQEATVVPDGKKEGSEIGGGIIQVAGTLYNAALEANMEVVEREHNLWPSEYVVVGMDATLDAAGEIDLKLKNNSEYSMYISAVFENKVLTVKIFGQPLEYEVFIENRLINEVPAPHAEVVYTEDYPEGEQHTKSISREGREVEIYRHYLEDGRTVDSELISHDVYHEIRGVILQGTGPGE